MPINTALNGNTTCNMILKITSCYIALTSFVGAEEAESIMWHGSKLVVEVPDNLVRVDNTNSDIAKIFNETKPESYALLFAFVDHKSLKAASETRLHGDSAPLPYATVAAPQDFLIPDRTPSMTPAEMVEAMKIHIAQEKAKGEGVAKSAIISQSENHLTILTRSQVERKVAGKIVNEDMADVTSYVNTGKIFVMISVTGRWTTEAEVFNLASFNDKLREGLKIGLFSKICG